MTSPYRSESWQTERKTDPRLEGLESRAKEVCTKIGSFKRVWRNSGVSADKAQDLLLRHGIHVTPRILGGFTLSRFAKCECR